MGKPKGKKKDKKKKQQQQQPRAGWHGRAEWRTH
jgi:hypothetical protein